MGAMDLDRLEEYKTTVMRLFPLFPRRLVDAYSINNDDAITLTRFLDCYPQEPVIALEVGTFIGVSAFHLAHQSKVSEVVCIDRNQSLAALGKSLAIRPDRHEFQLGPGASPSVGVLDVAEAALAHFPEQWRKVRLITGTTESVPVPTPANGASLVAFVDGDHSKEGVETDLRAIFEKNPYAVAVLHDCVDASNGPAILSGVAAFIEASQIGYRFRLFKQLNTNPQQPNLGVLYPETVADQLEQSARELLDNSTSALFRVSYLRWEASLKQQNQAKQLQKEAEQQLRLEKQNQAKQLRKEAEQQLRLERTKALKMRKELERQFRRENQRTRRRLRNVQGQLESIRASRTWKLVKVLRRIKSIFI